MCRILNLLGSNDCINQCLEYYNVITSCSNDILHEDLCITLISLDLLSWILMKHTDLLA